MTTMTHRLRPRPWYLACLAVALFTTSMVMMRFGIADWITVIGMSFGGTLGMGFAMRMEAGPEGIKMGSRTEPWDRVEVRRGRFGIAIQTAQPTSRFSRLSVFLPIFVADWPNSELRGHVRRWAPHLDL